MRRVSDMEWISVKDNLPETPDTQCLLFMGHDSGDKNMRGHIMIGKRSGMFRGFEYIGAPYAIHGITHWMLCPELPDK